MEYTQDFFTETNFYQIDTTNLIFDVIPEQPSIIDNIINTARQFLKWKYVWGGKHPSHGGFDCSGLIQYVFNKNGIKLPRGTALQFKSGKRIHNLTEVRPGDLICTKGSGPSRRHIKMVTENKDGQIKVIHAKGKKWGIVEEPLKQINNIISIRRIID